MKLPIPERLVATLTASALVAFSPLPPSFQQAHAAQLPNKELQSSPLIDELLRRTEANKGKNSAQVKAVTDSNAFQSIEGYSSTSDKPKFEFAPAPAKANKADKPLPKGFSLTPAAGMELLNEKASTSASFEPPKFGDIVGRMKEAANGAAEQAPSPAPAPPAVTPTPSPPVVMPDPPPPPPTPPPPAVAPPPAASTSTQDTADKAAEMRASASAAIASADAEASTLVAAADKEAATLEQSAKAVATRITVRRLV